jgi:ribosomal protein S18 acetylase RimI-like enzyme
VRARQGRAKFRRQALDWLRSDVKLWSRCIGGNDPRERGLAGKTLQRWLRDPALASLRDPDAVAKLPPEARSVAAVLGGCGGTAEDDPGRKGKVIGRQPGRETDPARKMTIAFLREEEVMELHVEPAGTTWFTPATLARAVRVHGTDLHTSQVVYQSGVAAGIALLAHRGWTTRLAAMGIVPEFRHTGIGQWLLDKILAAGRQRGDRVWTLEVIEDNTPALRLYEKVGFTACRRLLGYHCGNPQGGPSPAVEEVDVREVAQVLLQVGPPDLPWQVSGETVAQLGPPARGFRLGDAWAVIEPQETRVELLALVVPPRARRQGAATRLLKALFSHYPGTSWRVAARFPEETPPGLFTKLGFVQDTIQQKEMFLRLAT